MLKVIQDSFNSVGYMVWHYAIVYLGAGKQGMFKLKKDMSVIDLKGSKIIFHFKHNQQAA